MAKRVIVNPLGDASAPEPTQRITDTYYRPTERNVAGAPIGENALTQMADAIGEFNQSFRQYYSEPRFKSMQETLDYDAQQIRARYENQEAFVQARKDGTIDYKDNPYLLAKLDENIAQYQYGQFVRQYEGLLHDQNLIDDPEAFNKATAELREEFLGNATSHQQYLMTGAIDGYVQSQALRYDEKVREKIYEDTIDSSLKIGLFGITNDEILAGIASGNEDHEYYKQSKSALQNHLAEVQKQGILDIKDYTERIVSAYVAKAEMLAENGNVTKANNLLDFISGIETSKGNTIGSNPTYKLSLDNQRLKLKDIAEKQSAKAESEDRKLENELFDAMANSALDLDPTQQLSQYTEQLKDLNPQAFEKDPARFTEEAQRLQSAALSRLTQDDRNRLSQQHLNDQVRNQELTKETENIINSFDIANTDDPFEAKIQLQKRINKLWTDERKQMPAWAALMIEEKSPEGFGDRIADVKQAFDEIIRDYNTIQTPQGETAERNAGMGGIANSFFNSNIAFQQYLNNGLTAHMNTDEFRALSLADQQKSVLEWARSQQPTMRQMFVDHYEQSYAGKEEDNTDIDNITTATNESAIKFESEKNTTIRYLDSVIRDKDTTRRRITTKLITESINTGDINSLQYKMGMSDEDFRELVSLDKDVRKAVTDYIFKRLDKPIEQWTALDQMLLRTFDPRQTLLVDNLDDANALFDLFLSSYGADGLAEMGISDANTLLDVQQQLLEGYNQKKLNYIQINKQGAPVIDRSTPRDTVDRSEVGQQMQESIERGGMW